METTKFIRNVQEQNKENYFHNKSRFINTINQITNLSIPLNKNIIDVEYIAKKNNCLTEILQLEEKMDYHRNTDYLKGTIFPVLENYEYTNNIENVLKQMESACIDKTNITFDKNEYYFKFTGTYGQITVFPLSKYLERNFSLQKRSNNKFCIDSAIFYSLQYDWKIGITLLDGKWNDDVYIH